MGTHMTRRRKGAANDVPGIFILVGLAVLVFQEFWPYIVAIAGVAVLIRYVVLPAFRGVATGSPVPEHAGSLPRFTPIMRQQVRADAQVELVVDWPETFLEIKRAIDAGDFDFARTWLQKYAYTLPGPDVPEETRDQFKILMTAFAERDPLYQSIIPEICYRVAVEPGILQTALYPLFPRHSTETLRYVLYFGECLGAIKREKKGRSYRLFPGVFSSEDKTFGSRLAPSNRTLAPASTLLGETELLSRHPLFSRVTSADLEMELRAKGLKPRTVAGILAFFESQRQVFLRDEGRRIQHIDVMPVLMFDAIQDDRTCDFCRNLDGKGMRIDREGKFITRLPPFALGCRTSVTSMTERQVTRRGVVDCTEEILKLAVPRECPCAAWIDNHYWR